MKGSRWALGRGARALLHPSLLLMLGCSSSDVRVVSGVGSSPDAGAAAAPAGSALCGGAEESCCPGPLPACRRGLSCDPNDGVCRESGPSCDPSLATCAAAQQAPLCRTARDCAPNETCCAAGAVGTCIWLEPSAECPRPDLGIGFSRLPSLLGELDVDPGACSLGCYQGSGSRRILYIEPRLFNFGSASVMLGALGAPGTRLGCRPYLENALIYELWGEGDTLVRQVDARLGPGCNEFERRRGFSCEFLGLERGLFDDDPAGCQGLDITGVPEGDYRLVLRLQLDPAVLPDADTSNNRIELPIRLVSSFDPLAACSTGDPVYVTNETIDCGWSAPLSGACRPGEGFAVSCPDCEGDPVLRLCSGSAPCVFNDHLGGDDVYAGPGACPKAVGICPESGTFTAMVSPHTPGESFRCEPQLILDEANPLAPCSPGDPFGFPGRECGWTVAASESCVPGERLSVGCLGCEGDPILRICEGDTACTDASPEVIGRSNAHVDGGLDLLPCPLAGFTCPADGTYTTLVSNFDFNQPFACVPGRVAAIDPQTPCSEGIAPAWSGTRACGYAPAGGGSCSPGEVVDVACRLCSDWINLLACDGPDPCAPGSREDLGDAVGNADTCPALTLTCPASGQYSAWVTLSANTEATECTLVIDR